MATNGYTDSLQARAREHPLRRAILTLLSDHSPLTATLICNGIPGESDLATVSYHLRILSRAELVKEDGDLTAPVYSLSV